jgi:hypothetical protein
MNQYIPCKPEPSDDNPKILVCPLTGETEYDCVRCDEVYRELLEEMEGRE